MSSAVPMNSARRTITFAAADLDDDNGVEPSFPTVVGVVTMVPADYNGAAVAASKWIKCPRTITITRSSSAGAYSTNPIVLTGTRGGLAVTESLTPATANGNDQLRGVQAFDYPPTIVFPAQVSTAGAFEIGCGNICTPQPGDTFTAIKLRGTAGQINVQYGDSVGSPTDSFAATSGDLEPIAFTRVLTSDALTAPTLVALTVYCP
jgi:hypothetical protein